MRQSGPGIIDHALLQSRKLSGGIPTAQAGLSNQRFDQIRNFGFAFLVGTSLLLSGCSKGPSPVTNNAAPARWNWQSQPLVEKMRLGVLPCRVMPKSFQNINSPLTGTLRVYVDRPQTNLPAGFVWARFEPKVFEAQSNALSEARRKLDEKEKLTLALELPRQIL